MKLFSWLKGTFYFLYYWFWADLIYLASKLFFRLKYRYKEKIPKKGKLVVVANHQSFLDPPLIGIGTGRRNYYMGRKTLFKGLAGWHLHALNTYPIDKDNPIGGVKKTLRLLQEENCVVMFPEGTRTPDGKMHSFLGGVLAIAKRSKAPILPAAISGAYEAFPRDKKLPRPHKVIVTYGRIIPAEEIQAMSNDELLRFLEYQVRELLGEEIPAPLPEEQH